MSKLGYQVDLSDIFCCINFVKFIIDNMMASDF